jgi:hypothetical protein
LHFGHRVTLAPRLARVINARGLNQLGHKEGMVTVSPDKLNQSRPTLIDFKDHVPRRLQRRVQFV